MLENNDDICRCFFKRNIPILVGESVDKIRMKYVPKDGKPFPETRRLGEIVAPTNCRYCIVYGEEYYCGNEQRITKYEQDMAFETTSTKSKTTKRIPRIKLLN